LFVVVFGLISSANDETEKKKNGYQSSAKTIPNFKMNKALAHRIAAGTFPKIGTPCKGNTLSG
jgi:hypothetical protein